MSKGRNGQAVPLASLMAKTMDTALGNGGSAKELTLAYSVDGIPSGLSIDGQGRIVGTIAPNAAAMDYAVTVWVENDGASVSLLASQSPQSCPPYWTIQRNRGSSGQKSVDLALHFA